MNLIAFIVLWATRFLFIGVLIVISLFVILFVSKILNTIKKLIVWLAISKVKRIELFPRYQTYRKVHQHVGYSIDYRWHSVRDYYHIKDVPDGYMRKVKVYFYNQMSLSVKVKEESVLYKEIIKRTKQ